VTPDDFMGDVIGNLSVGAARSHAWRAGPRAGHQPRTFAEGDVGLRTDLRSMTQGRAT